MHILKSQTFSDSELIDFALELSTKKTGTLKERLLHWDFGPVMTMKHDPSARNYLFSDEAVPFHWDGAFYREPHLLLFYCLNSKGLGGETLFCDTNKLWNSMTIEEQSLCRELVLDYESEKLAYYGGKITVRPVQEHPVNGRTILRLAERVETELNPVQLKVSGFEGAEEFFQYLCTLLYRPEFIYEHRWESGDVIVCDNFTYLHGRRSLGANRERTFKRIQIL